MCGIMAWAGRSPKTFNKDKFNLLGTMNETRGTDSCGVAVDGEIFFGVDDNKRYRDFLANIGYPTPENIPIVIGHTRKSTVGSNTIANAHPFGFGDAENNKELFAFIGVHNGTLHNHKQLAKDNKIEIERNNISSKNVPYVTDKIDSEILLETIYKSKKFKVLSQYNGAAALVFYNVNEPDTIFAFHGASIKKKDGTDKSIYIERELWAWQEHKNSLYISSQDHALMAIGGTEKTMTHLKTNVVYKIKNGDLKNSEQFPISRVNQQQDKDYYSHCNHNKIADKKKSEEDYVNAYRNSTGGTKELSFPFCKSSSASSISDDVNIHHDKKVGKADKKISMEKLRYNRNGHGISGIYIWIPGHGFHTLGFNLKDAESAFKNVINRRWYRGDFVWNDSVLKKAKEEDIKIPFPSGAGFKNNIGNFIEYFHFFIDGMKIIGYKDWEKATELSKSGNGFSIRAISNITCHPVVDIDHKKSANSQGIYYKGVLANSEGFSPLGSYKTYKIKKGNCIGITINSGIEHRKPYSNLELIVSALKDNEKQLQIDLNSKKVINLHEKTESLDVSFREDALEKLLDEMFLTPIEKFQQNRIRLVSYKDLELGKMALEIFQDFIRDASVLVGQEFDS